MNRASTAESGTSSVGAVVASAGRVGDWLQQRRTGRREKDPDVEAVEQRITRLDARVDRLANELADARSQGRRAAELADLVTELLSNEASRRDARFAEILRRYTGAG